MNRTLPLFPLETVLFPGADLPLQVFEPRYREMLRDCVAADRRFGVVLIKSGQEVGGAAEPFSVGTVALIRDIAPPRRGAIPIIVTGEQRFRIISLDRIRPYLSAEVEVLEDSPDDIAPDDLIRAAREEAQRYLASVLAAQGAFRAELDVPEEPVTLSYFTGMVASAAPTRSLQTLLEADRLGDRLQAGIALLEEEAAQMRSVFMRAGPGRERSLFSSN